MDEIAMLGEVHDGIEKPRKLHKPKTKIGQFFKLHKHERITHWCKECRRWHGPSCFYSGE